MENKLRKQNCMAVNSSSPRSLAVHRDSQAISRAKPKIRIIHIFAPEIIKTDVENFRELVQQLTGKPTGDDQKKFCRKKQPRKKDQHAGLSENSQILNRKMEVHRNGLILEMDQPRDQKVKEEVLGLRCNDENSGGYMGGFSDLEGFISEIGGLPLLPYNLDSTPMQGLEELQLQS